MIQVKREIKSRDSVGGKRSCLIIYMGGMDSKPLTQCPLKDVEINLKVWFSDSLYRIVAWAFGVKLFSGDWRRSLLMISQHWFRQWLGAVRQQAITWTSVDQDLQRHMASFGPSELTWWALRYPALCTISCMLYNIQPLYYIIYVVIYPIVRSSWFSLILDN